jgi:hypothetical protein
MALLHRELSVVCSAYLLAGIPIAFVAIAGTWSPFYRQPFATLARWWSWMALVFVASALSFNALAVV